MIVAPGPGQYNPLPKSRVKGGKALADKVRRNYFAIFPTHILHSPDGSIQAARFRHARSRGVFPTANISSFVQSTRYARAIVPGSRRDARREDGAKKGAPVNSLSRTELRLRRGERRRVETAETAQERSLSGTGFLCRCSCNIYKEDSKTIWD